MKINTPNPPLIAPYIINPKEMNDEHKKLKKLEHDIVKYLRKNKCKKIDLLMLCQMEKGSHICNMHMDL